MTVQAAAIFDYQVKATLHLFDGVAAGPCLEAAQAAMDTYLTDQKKLGRSVRRESYGAVLRVAGVDWVEITEPAQDIILNPHAGKQLHGGCRYRCQRQRGQKDEPEPVTGPASSALERRLAEACSGISGLDVPLRDLWNPAACPVWFLPYLAWSFSVDRWDEAWTETVKRRVVMDAFYIHQHKGTISAVRRVVEPFGFLIRVLEWWRTGETPGTFRLDIGVQVSGITEETYQELERLISDAQPCSRHMLGMSINLQSGGPCFTVCGQLRRRRPCRLSLHARSYLRRWPGILRARRFTLST